MEPATGTGMLGVVSGRVHCPPDVSGQPYDILAHQTLSIVKSTSGIGAAELVRELAGNSAFLQITEDEVREIVDHLRTSVMLEQVGRELIIGLDGENLVNHREFYSMFQTEEQFQVFHSGNAIGEES